MLDYGWGNAPPVLLSGDEPEPTLNSDPANHAVDHYAVAEPTFIQHNNHLVGPTQHPTAAAATPFSHHFTPHFNSFYDPHGYPSGCHYAPHPLLSIDPVAGGGNGAEFLLVPKSEEVSRPPPMDFASRIGLNLGGRTYFSSSEEDFVNRLYRRSRTGDSVSSNSPRCQAEGCNVDLTHAKHYHRRHKVCEFHSKASTVITAGLTQRFCQQCSRFLSKYPNYP